jgi:Protein of unknown function (DUF4231)
MDQAKFRYYEENRYGGELHGCEKWGFRNDWAYKLLQLLVILFSALVTAAIALEQLIPNFPGRLSALIASLVVTSAAAALKIFNFQGKALYYEKKADALKREYNLYKAADGDYSQAADKEQLFVRRIEDIITEANKQRESVYFPGSMSRDG